MSRPQKHANFWFDDGNLVLQAETTTFKLPRSFLCRESEFFSTLNGLDQYLPADGQDGTEERPLFLHDVPAEAFANILKILYTMYEALWGAELDFEEQELIAMLRASHRLLFMGVHAVVARLLHPRLDSELRLHLGISAYGVDDWALPAFTELVYAYETRPSEDNDTLLVPASIWSTIYDLRSKIQRARVRAAATLATTPLSDWSKNSFSQCGEHVHELWGFMTEEGDAAALKTRLEQQKASIRTYRDKNCSCYSLHASDVVDKVMKWENIGELSKESEWLDAMRVRSTRPLTTSSLSVAAWSCDGRLPLMYLTSLCTR